LADKATFPRDKYCGDGLTSAALKLLKSLGVAFQTLDSYQPIREVVLRSPQGRENVYPFPENGTLGAVVKRRELDFELVRCAKAEGAELLEAHRATAIDQDDTGVSLSFATADSAIRQVRAKHVVAADGVWSPLRTMLGLRLPKYRGDWHAFRHYFVDTQASQTLRVWFEPEILPGYVWAFPLADGRANVGFGVSRHTHRTGDLSRLWNELLERPHIAEALGRDARPDDRPRAWPIPTALGELPLSAGRVLFCGDAGGMCDPMTGEGIAQALLSGELAAQALGASADKNVASRYRALVWRHLRRDNRFARKLGKALQTPRGVAMAMTLSGANSFTRRNFARWLFEDYPRALIITPDRWLSTR